MPEAMYSMRSSPGAVRLGVAGLVGPGDLEAPAPEGEKLLVESTEVGTVGRRGGGGGGGREEEETGVGTSKAGGEEREGAPGEGRKGERMWWRL